MTQNVFLDLLSYLEPMLCGVALAMLLHSKASSKFFYLVGLLSVKITASMACIALLLFGPKLLGLRHAYPAYFYTYWTSYALEAILSLLVVYSIFKLAMA